VNVWYRSVDGCPDGPAFLERLEARSVPARLAQVGDAIDFVVTIGEASGKSEGLLERQTQAGAVSIRRLSGDDCGQVADALALSLVLALDPEAGAAASPPTASPAPPPEPRPAPARPPAVPPAKRNAPSPHSPARAVDWFIGLQGLVTTGVTPDPLLGGTMFGEVEARRFSLPRSSLRLSAAGGFASSSTESAEFSIAVWSGELEVCPLGFGGSAFTVKPCLGYALGRLAYSGNNRNGRDDEALWSAFVPRGRLAWSISPRIRLEAQAGASFPLTRYELLSGDPRRVVYQTPPVGAAVGLGAALGLP